MQGIVLGPVTIYISDMPRDDNVQISLYESAYVFLAPMHCSIYIYINHYILCAN